MDFPALDLTVLQFWDANHIFQRTITEREGCPDYVAYDGPPGTNGAPHIGHMMQSALKDLWPRFKTMQGYRVLRKAGWDTHGLPVELTAEKELGFKSKRDIEAYGIEKYIEYCRSTVYRYKNAWTEAIRRIGRFLDTKNYYATLTKDYIQSDWWVLKQAWDKGLLYQDYRIMPYCCRCGTTLSQHETAQGYKDIQDISLYVKFPVAEKPNTYFVAWTTTPWTLLSNVALAVNPVLNYITIETHGERLIFAESCLDVISKLIDGYKIVESQKGEYLDGKKYYPLWSFQADNRAHIVIVDDYVTAVDGSGIVHLALYGEDDFRLIRKNNLPMVQNVDADGKCVSITGEFAGRWFRDEGLDVDILKDLASRGLLLGKEKIIHSYPHCYRCDTPLMYFAMSGWFIRTTAFKEQMLRANQEINWYPAHIKDGRFGNWLENNVDWNISRNRYWGSPLPIWTCGSCGYRVCVESLADLELRLGKPLGPDFDPHKPYIDRIEFKCERCSGMMKREPEVLDSWFNAGIMPWGQWGYPSAEGSKELFEKQFPGDFICEAIDQTRGWFYTMLAISVMLKNCSSYKNCICTELISDIEGRKMSKSRGNVVDPIELCNKYGADAVRWNFYSINPWTARRFDEEEISEGLRQVIIPYWNAYSFFVTYARVDEWKPNDEIALNENENLLDRWILSRLEWLKSSVTNALENYDVAAAAGTIRQFIDELTNWYIRRSRRRFWKSEDDRDKKLAYHTLFTVLTTTNRILAPFLPFICEVIYQNLERAYYINKSDSVHLEYWPKPQPQYRDEPLEKVMESVREVITLARSLRAEGGTRVRQPLSLMIVAVVDKYSLEPYIDVILDELNIKNLNFAESGEELFIWKARGEWKALGPRFGVRAKNIIETISALPSAKVKQLKEEGSIVIEGETVRSEEVTFIQEPKEGFWVRSEKEVTVAIDHRIDDELLKEGLAREFVHQIQNLRRDLAFEVTQRIRIEYYEAAPQVQVTLAIEKFKSYICNETLSLDIIKKEDKDQQFQEVKVGDYLTYVRIIKEEKRKTDGA